jgi:uncharacterized membrane protein
MKSRARIHTHPIHPMIVALPIGLWVFSLIADILCLSGFHGSWRETAAYAMAFGCCTALIAAVPGLIDYFMITGEKAKRTATWHLVINLVVTGLYAGNFFLRVSHDYDPGGIPFLLSVLGIGFLGVSGWLGGDLVYIHKMGVIEESPRM